MPKTAQNKCHKKIYMHTRIRAAITTKRYVYIVTKITTQSNMPAPPEILYIKGLIGGIEV
ncbi:hypothetical protein D3C78_845300 [compost metagenome]